MIRRLRLKFIAINMSMVALMLGILLGLVYQFTKIDLERESINMMRSIAERPFRTERPDELPPELRLPYFTVHIDNKGDIATNGGYFDLSDKKFLRELVEESAASGRESGVLQEHNLRFFRINGHLGSTYVFSDMSSEENTLTNLRRTLYLIGLGGVILFLSLSIVLSRWAVKPVEQAWQQQKQFISDASHELKTPLTVILTNAELLTEGEGNEECRQSFSRGILAMARQMRTLVEQMLLLARSEEREEPAFTETVDLSALAEDAAISFEGVFMDRGLMLESEIDPGIRLRGSSADLKRVLDILLDNAQKYSCPGGVTRLTLNSTGSRCRLSVASPGEAIGEGERSAIFRRFYRGDRARSRDGSFGLGLPIAERIVDMHRGKIWCESAGGINTFTVELKKL